MSALLLLAQAGNDMQLPLDPEITMTGWLFMGSAWVFVTGLVVWCFAKVLRGDKAS